MKPIEQFLQGITWYGFGFGDPLKFIFIALLGGGGRWGGGYMELGGPIPCGGVGVGGGGYTELVAPGRKPLPPPSMKNVTQNAPGIIIKQTALNKRTDASNEQINKQINKQTNRTLLVSS